MNRFCGADSAATGLRIHSQAYGSVLNVHGKDGLYPLLFTLCTRGDVLIRAYYTDPDRTIDAVSRHIKRRLSRE